MREMSRKELIFLKDMLKKVQKFIWERGSGRVPYCYVRFEYMFHNIEIYLQSWKRIFSCCVRFCKEIGRKQIINW